MFLVPPAWMIFFLTWAACWWTVSPPVLPGMPVPAYQAAPFVLARDGQTPLAFTDPHGTWLQWLPATTP